MMITPATPSDDKFRSAPPVGHRQRWKTHNDLLVFGEIGASYIYLIVSYGPVLQTSPERHGLRAGKALSSGSLISLARRRRSFVLLLCAA